MANSDSLYLSSQWPRTFLCSIHYPSLLGTFGSIPLTQGFLSSHLLSGMMGNVCCYFYARWLQSFTALFWTVWDHYALRLLSKAPYSPFEQSHTSWLWSIWSLALYRNQYAGHIGGFSSCHVGLCLSSKRVALWTELYQMSGPSLFLLSLYFLGKNLDLWEEYRQKSQLFNCFGLSS